MSTLMEYLPVLLPVIIIQLVLMLTALVHALRHPHYRFGNRIIWVLVIVFGQMIGPIIYFVIGRGEEE
ncbi:PLD nuclease N-terminal domain-containing protein [Faecalicatena orotica]|uniref:PLD nuclease N-terminal domain-containing protein n=1 Tax=Faecalicatena orotica TaxID=1544 RepID=UPI003217F354